MAMRRFDDLKNTVVWLKCYEIGYVNRLYLRSSSHLWIHPDTCSNRVITNVTIFKSTLVQLRWSNFRTVDFYIWATISVLWSYSNWYSGFSLRSSHSRTLFIFIEQNIKVLKLLAFYNVIQIFVGEMSILYWNKLKRFQQKSI